MSWFLATCTPGLLMLGAVGLQRLESVMQGDRPSAGQLVTRREHAAHTAREKAAQQALSELSGLGSATESAHLLLADEPGLPTRPNPMIRPARIPKPV